MITTQGTHVGLEEILLVKSIEEDIQMSNDLVDITRGLTLEQI